MSALIWLGIVAVWGFVLIPMWLRHHDSTLEQRSAERFSTAMRVLSRRGSAREEAAVVPTARSSDRSVAATRPPERRAAEAARAALVRARRQRLMVLLAAVPTSLVVALAAGGTWFVVQGIVDVGLVAYVAYLRHTARVERRLRASRAARDRQLAAARAARASAWRSGANPSPLGPPNAGAAAPAVSREASREVRFSPLVARRSEAEAATSATSAAAPGRGAVGYDLASIETVDLSEVIEAAAAERELAEAQAEVERVVEAAVVDSYVVDGAADADADAEAEADVEAGEPDPYRAGAGRPAARTGRPTTSKPGRVQVNPPGTHGGLTAPPGAAPASAPAAASASASSPETGQRDGDDPDDLDQLLERHAAGA